jgi:phage replication-related protein YjqB (UPF0714/DUF867 family)
MRKLISVLKAKSEMLICLTDENCTIDPELASNPEFNFRKGQQCRITVKDYAKRYGLITIHSKIQGVDNNSIQMRLSGRERFCESESFEAYLEDAGVKRDKDKLWLERHNEFGEFLDEDNNATVVFCAPHGGKIEEFTDEQAKSAYARIRDIHGKAAACWRCCGWHASLRASKAWHITSTDISRLSFPKLDRIGDRNFKYAVAFHGYSENEILIGGSASEHLKVTICSAIQNACGSDNVVVKITSGGHYSGTDPDNFVNWLTKSGAGGIQIEQPYVARQKFGTEIAEAVADAFAEIL